MKSKSFLKLSKILIENLSSTKLVTPKKDRVYEFQKYKNMKTFWIS